VNKVIKLLFNYRLPQTVLAFYMTSLSRMILSEGLVRSLILISKILSLDIRDSLPYFLFLVLLALI